MSPVEDLLQQAVALHQAGQLAQAESLYRQILQIQPRHADALHLLGYVAHQTGHSEAAIEHIRQAIALKPSADAYHSNLGIVYSDLKRYREAIPCFRKAIRINPEFADAYNNLGLALAESGEFEEAFKQLRKALRLRSNFPEAYNNLGKALEAQGKDEEAEAQFRAALRLNPNYARGHYNLAQLLQKQGKIEAAIASYQAALRLNPGYADALLGLARLAGEQGDLTGAEELLRRAMQAAPRDPEPLVLLAQLLASRHEFSAAEPLCRKAIALAPEHDEAYLALGSILRELQMMEQAEQVLRTAWRLKPSLGSSNNLANVLADLKQYEEAETMYRHALEFNPPPNAKAVIHSNLGNALQEQGQYAEAERYFREALKIDPSLHQIHTNLGLALNDQGRPLEAIAAFEQALQLHPEYPLARWGRSRAYLALGDFARAWPDHEWRWQHREGRPYCMDPRYPGKFAPRPSEIVPVRFEGSRFFVMHDEGIGDELFYLRFAPYLKARGAWLAYATTPKIESLARRLDCLDQAQVGVNTVPENIDYVLGVSDLPLVSEITIAAPSLRLAPLPEALERIRQRLAEIGPPPYMGVTWRAGNPMAGYGRKKLLQKEVEAHRLAEILRPRHATVLVLQRNPQPGEIAEFSRALGRPAHDFSDLNEALEDMLALLSVMDEYIGVSNTNMHLRAMAGKTARVLLPLPPEWRWMAAGKESPWFPGFPVYRQHPQTGWDEALAELARDVGMT